MQCILLADALAVEMTGNYVSDFKQNPTVADGSSLKNLFWAQQQQSIQPACIVHIRSAEDVAAVVSTARTTGCPFAVRGGGHSDIKGASNIDGGITVNMAGLNDIDLNETEGLVRVGAGATWRPAATEPRRHGTVPVSGRPHKQMRPTPRATRPRLPATPPRRRSPDASGALEDRPDLRRQARHRFLVVRGREA